MSIKLFAKNTVIYTFGTIAIRVSTFLLIPLYTHYFSVSEYGVLATLLLTNQILLMIIDFGMMPSVIRFTDTFLKAGNVGKLLGSVLLINITAGVIITAAAPILINPILVSLFKNITPKYSILISLSAVFQCITINLLSYFRAANKASVYIWSSIILTVFYSLITIFIVVVLKWGILSVFISQIIAYGVVGIFIIYYIAKQNKLSLSKSVVADIFKFGFPLIFARSGDLIMDTFLIYFLGYYASLEAVGIYSLASKIASILLVLLITPFQLSYEPFLYSKLDDPHLPNRISHIFTYLILVFVFLALFLLILFKYLLGIIAPASYQSAYYLIFFFLPLYALRGINTISQALIHIQKKTNITGTVVLINTFFFVLFSYFIVKEFFSIGAIVMSNLYWLSMSMVLLFYGQKHYPIKMEKNRILFLITIYFILNIAIYNLSMLNNNVFYSIITPSLFLSIFLLFKLNFFYEFEKTLLKKVRNIGIDYIKKVHV